MTSQLQQAAERGDFLLTAEVAPPKGADPRHMLMRASLLRDRVHAINVTDGSRAVMRMSSLAACAILRQQGMEPVCQVTCRDRNRIGLQADLLGSQALGIRNVLALTGDPVKAGDQPEARPVFDLEAVRLLKLIDQLNHGLDAKGQRLPDGPTSLFLGAAVDPQLRNWASLKQRFERKVEAGARFFQSQLICDFDRLAEFMDKIARPCERPVLAGIFLLKSAKNAEFINRYVPGIHISEAVIGRLGQARDPLMEGVQIAAEQVQLARQICDGVHLMAVKREDLIPQILDRAGIAPLKPELTPIG
jgi:methylenetetrahydrofolate reductase (NADPH)